MPGCIPEPFLTRWQRATNYCSSRESNPRLAARCRLSSSGSLEMRNAHKILVGILQRKSAAREKPGVEWKIRYWKDLGLV
jgi:hypothetical protein